MNKGCIVIESCEDYEQILCLETGDNLPLGGILCWPNEGFERHVFSERKLARSAIERTHHYAKAYSQRDMPERKCCSVKAINLPELANG